MEEQRDASTIVGRRLGEFVVREQLSSGGFGMVFRAEQPALAREAVIKVLHFRHRASETVIQRFLREARLASRLDHPYAAHMYAFGAEPDGLMWIAMEMVRGTPLDRMLSVKGPIPLERFVPLLERICQVVQTAHDQGIVHRDLKPANVMVLVRAGQLLPKLLDLGLAKIDQELSAEPLPTASTSLSTRRLGSDPAVSREELQGQALAETEAPTQSDASSSGRLTEDGAVMGSPVYMAPEQWTDAATVDGRTDIYALGILSYEALTNNPPFTGTTRMQLAMAHAGQAPPRLGPSFPAALDDVIARALAKFPEERYPTALELAAAFRTASGIAEEPVGVPRLDDGVRIHALAQAPQPLAQAVMALDAARNVHQAQYATSQVVRVATRLVGVIALAAHAHVGTAGKMSDSDLSDSLRRLRQRSVPDAEWLALARELTAPFASVRAAYPVPELLDFLDAPASPLVELLALRERDIGTANTQVQTYLEQAMPLVGKLLEALEFLASYQLALPSEDGVQIWNGVGRGELSRQAARGPALTAGQPAILDADGNAVVSLWPFVQVREPGPGVPPHVFFLEGKGRTGARMIALPETFEHDDEQAWEALGGMVRDRAAPSISDEEVCPYPGLAAFSPQDATRFFGRERETEGFVNRLRAQPLLAVVGPSGAGKSSFIQAGVIPSLPDDWRVVTLRPGPSPLVSLTARLQNFADPAVLRASLDKDPASLGALLRSREGGGTTMIVVDQLEELFTLCDDAAERDRFVEILVRAARAADDPVRVVFTLRDDFLLNAEALPALRSRLAPALHLLTTPSPDDLRRILREPLRLAGYELDDPSLASEMVTALADTRSPLALLSFTGTKLWELRDRRFRQITRKSYRSLGGVAGALAKHAEETLAQMGPDEQRLAREVFRHAVTADGTRSVLGRKELDQLLGGGAHATTVLEKLIGARLLAVAEGPTGEEQVEITHEALITAWPRLVTWRREDAEGARLRDQLRSTAKQWDERGRPTGLLWRGDALAEYRLWRSRYPGSLADLERAFAEASLADAARGARRRTIAIAIAFSLLALGVVALLFQNARVASQRERARDKEDEANRAANRLSANLMAQYEDQGRRYVLDGDPRRGLAFLAEAEKLGMQGAPHQLMVDLAASELRNEIKALPHGNAVRMSRFTPDGRTVVTGGYDKTTRLWDAESGALLRELPTDDTVYQLDITRDGSTLLTATSGGKATLWRLADGQKLVEVTGHGDGLQSALVTPDGKSLVTIARDDVVELWDATTGAKRSVLQPAAHPVAPLLSGVPAALSVDGTRLAVGDNLGVLRIWELPSGKLVASNTDAHEQINTVRFSRDGALIVVSSNDKTAAVLDASGHRLHAITHDSRVNDAELSPDGSLVASAANDRATIVWSTRTGEVLYRFGGHQAGVNVVAWRGDGKQLATGGDDGLVLLWNLSNGGREARLLGHTGALHDLGYAPDGARLVSASEDNTVILWRSAPQLPMTHLVGPTDITYSAEFSPDGSHVVTASGDGTVRVWDRATGRELTKATQPGAARRALYSPDGRWIVSVGDDGVVHVWNAATATSVKDLRGHDGAISDVAWLPDSTRLLTAGADGTARVWSIERDQPLLVYRGHKAGVLSVALDAKAAIAVTTSDDNTTRTWNVDTGQDQAQWFDPGTLVSASFDPSGDRLVGSLNGAIARIWNAHAREPDAKSIELRDHKGSVMTARWSPDGAYVVTSSIDATTRIWNANNGDQLAILQIHQNSQMWSASYSPDGRYIVTTSDDGSATIWELPAPTRDVDRLLRCQVPYEIDNGQLVPRKTTCT